MHPRLIASNGDVALAALRGQVAAAEFVEGREAMVLQPTADMFRQPGQVLDCQLLYGAVVTVIAEADENGFVFAQAEADGYCGYVKATGLGALSPVTHRVSNLATHIFSAADIKSRPVMALPMGARINVTETVLDFGRTNAGWVPMQHVRAQEIASGDAADWAQKFLDCPYLWGGNTLNGIDCSGLVQQAFLQAGVSLQRDTDMQENAAGASLSSDAKLARNDLVFWKGHVGIMRDATNLIHANAHHMRVTREPLTIVADRIAANGGGKITSMRRVAMPA